MVSFAAFAVGLFTAGILLAGVVVASGSTYALILGGLDAAVLLLAVVAEEPWLAEQYGDAYERYRHRTPRFVGLPAGDG